LDYRLRRARAERERLRRPEPPRQWSRTASRGTGLTPPDHLIALAGTRRNR